MLIRRFYEVWVFGRLDKRGAEEIRKCLFEAIRRREERLRIRIYGQDLEDVSHLGELRKILLENTSLSIVVELRDSEKIAEDLGSHEGEVTLIISEPPPSTDLTRFQGKLRIIEVRNE